MLLLLGPLEGNFNAPSVQLDLSTKTEEQVTWLSPIAHEAL